MDENERNAEPASKSKYRRRNRSPKHKRQCKDPEEKNDRRRSRSRSSPSSVDSPSDDYSKAGSSAKSSLPAKFTVNLKPSLKSGIKLKLSRDPAQTALPKLTVASAFNNESEDEVEEMPAEAKMRMKNIGKNTPTSSGPNSFGKTKLGFIDTKKMFEKKIQQMLDSE